MTIDGKIWHPEVLEVELSRTDTPNYVDIASMVPDKEETVQTLPTQIDDLIGTEFELYANNELISNRATGAEEDSLLFAGRLANISATGKNSFEGVVYNPGGQAFAIGTDEEEENVEFGGGFMNSVIYLDRPKYNYDDMYDEDLGTSYFSQAILAEDLIETIMDRLRITDYDINLAEEGFTVTGPEGEKRDIGLNSIIHFEDSFVTVREALTRAREWTNSEWWFDKSGTFHFGAPEPVRHDLRYIIDSSAGKATPPYQSIRLIGSGSASAEGYGRTHMEIENRLEENLGKIVIEREIGKKGGEFVPVEVEVGEGREPTFEYHNLEISTDRQAKAAAKTIIEDLAEQQANGKVTVVGFPEVEPLDGINMPGNSKQPMGGFGYNVYKVKHHLNPSDGFITDIHVAGVTGVTATVVSADEGGSAYSIRNPITGETFSPEEYRTIREEQEIDEIFDEEDDDDDGGIIPDRAA